MKDKYLDAFIEDYLGATQVFNCSTTSSTSLVAA